jgi:hypothetical protein
VLGQVHAVVCREVHGEEGYVGRHVREAEAVRELDAIDGDGAVRLKVDVLEPQIAVSVAHAARGDARREAPSFVSQERGLPRLDLPRLLRREQLRQCLARLREVLRDVDGDRLRRAVPRGGLVGAAAVVKAREHGGQGLELLRAERAPMEEPIGASFVAEPRHVDGPLDDLSVCDPRR